VPRHDTSLRLPAELPREALRRDEALLDQVTPGGAWLQRVYLASAPAVVLGLGLWHRADQVVDVERCRAAGVDVLPRKAGGGAVLVDANMVCGAICAPLPAPGIPDDLTESYRWLGDRFVERLRACGVPGVRRVEVAEARADTEKLRAEQARLLQTTCYGGLSPHEIVAGPSARKLVGLAQVRRRHAVLFQFGILLRDQSPLADFLQIPNDSSRENLKEALRERTVGLFDLLETPGLTEQSERLSVFARPWAASDATPSAP
jgi:lipoate-protein ligase A